MYDPFNHVHEIELYWLQSFFAAPLLLEYDSNPPPSFFLSFALPCFSLSLFLRLSSLQDSSFRAGVLFQGMVGDGVPYNLRSYAAMLTAYSQ